MQWEFAYDSPKAIRELLAEKGFAPTKKFGQNFLLTESVRTEIVRLLTLSPNQHVIEIGPGLGALTTLLLKEKAHVTAFEIDRGFCEILREDAFGTHPNFTLIEGDAMRTLFSYLQSKERVDRICGNLPYNVGTTLVAKILESSYRPPVMLYTLQREVAERLAAEEQSSQWASLSLLAQMDYEVSIPLTISSGHFYPPPKVESSVVRFVLRKESRVPEALKTSFLLLVRETFGQRRKTIYNNIRRGKIGGMLPPEAIEQLFSTSGVDRQKRAEALSWEEFLALSSALDMLRASDTAGR